MDINDLLEKILYKKKYVGKVERNGKIFVKYTKIKRFKSIQNKQIILSLLAVLVLTIVYLYLRNLLISPKR